MTFQQSIEAVIKQSMNDVHAQYTKQIADLDARLKAIEERIKKATKEVKQS